MFEFLGVTLGTALSALPPHKSLYYQELIESGDSGYYRSVQRESDRKLAFSHKGEIESCVIIASYITNVDPDLIRTIMRSESGWPGANVAARNGANDLGIMQINEKVWDIEFSREGVNLDWKYIQNDTCANIYIGSVILSRRLSNSKSVFEGLANYHRFKTSSNQSFHISYRIKATQNLLAIQNEYSDWLNRFALILSYSKDASQ
ncbi:TPA: transglycosylase SLT domain-containing protein [Vibrio vulnificus]|uniref:transglycosylase SLT domain-containing protein n=1 Tax=Vibrio navarrensis TaxID=29495 RepID=UPI0018DBE381|nr:transglycosylase SLT domain-containing protein [Vibrio navarrensis]MBH9739945.1 hypothetical protein [Vibrio navarrensis]HAS6100744.1 transglycosylase SLT domain-containing protein [Vibrio vulnificus]